MTLWDTFTAIGRRWYIALLGLACTAGALYVIQEQPSVYYSRASVYFLAPASDLYPNVLRTTSLDLVVAAGVVGKRINGTATMTKTASSEVTIVGRGIRDGSSVGLLDNGGQWSTNYNVQALDVQVSAPSVEEVRARQDALFTQIADELQAIQEEHDVPEVDLITSVVVPENSLVVEMRGQRRRAQAMVLALGSSLTLLLIGSAELAARRSRARAVPKPA